MNRLLTLLSAAVMISGMSVSASLITVGTPLKGDREIDNHVAAYLWNFNHHVRDKLTGVTMKSFVEQKMAPGYTHAVLPGKLPFGRDVDLLVAAGGTKNAYAYSRAVRYDAPASMKTAVFPAHGYSRAVKNSPALWMNSYGYSSVPGAGWHGYHPPVCQEVIPGKQPVPEPSLLLLLGIGILSLPFLSRKKA